MAGCGSDAGGQPDINSDLPGIYQLTEFSFTEGGCDSQMTTSDNLSRFVLYPAAEIDEAIMVGGFCGDLEDCRARAREKPPNVNYSFFSGNDAAGWTGWGIADQSMVGEMCQVDVQTHTLVVPSSGAIRIDTRQVETLFTGEIVDDTATCIARDAVNAVRSDSPCQALFALEATFESGL